ncbi:hypothetical protein BDV06DRAFT_30321 [Aspergillus oleicola]
MDMLESQKELYNDWYAELIPYARGCAYLLQIDSRLRKVTGQFGAEQNSPSDEIIVDMGMLRGKILDLSDAVVIYEDWNLSSGLQEILEIGFDRLSNEKRVVSGVVPGSRAALAGLVDGARIVSMSRAGICSRSLSANMDLLVQRGGIKVHISYWPRSFCKARVWQLGGAMLLNRHVPERRRDHHVLGGEHVL